MAAPVDVALANLYPGLHQISNTPYDRQMRPIQSILREQAAAPSGVSVDEVRKLMRDISRIRYEKQQNWQRPEEVLRSHRTDCKGKALMLLQEMRQRGATDLMLIIGKRKASSNDTHVWIRWTVGKKVFLLDPTFFDRPWLEADFRKSEYQVLYAYDGHSKYRSI